MRALCVSIHDVAPATWPACERLLEQVRQVAPIPLSLLVVPHYHRLVDPEAMPLRRALDARLALGDELVLHGWTHLDEGPRAPLLGRIARRLRTRGEGEFAGLAAAEARRRLELGSAWFARRGWPLAGFVAPAWLVSPGAWEALRASAFRYTTTLRAFHPLPGGRPLAAPSLVWRSRGAWAARLSLAWNASLAQATRDAPLLRLSLHPADAWREDVTRQWQGLLRGLLEDRRALTKAGFAAALHSEAPLAAAQGARA